MDELAVLKVAFTWHNLHLLNTTSSDGINVEYHGGSSWQQQLTNLIPTDDRLFQFLGGKKICLVLIITLYCCVLSILRIIVIFVATISFMCVTEALIYECDHYSSTGDYNLRHCTLHGVTVVHDAEDVDFSSEYPRPYWFEFQQSRMEEIPRSLFTTFPEMQTIDLRNTGIENINKFTFEKAKQLRHLVLHGNRLKVLNNFIFKGCDLLEWLDLSHNQLQEVKEKTFHDIPLVKELYLDHNRLVTLPEDVFGELPNLAVLSLNDNLLTTLGERIFGYSQLISLNLNFNQLRTIHLKDAHQSWQKVYLRGNLLTSVVLPSVAVEIDLSHNNLTTIEIPYEQMAVKLLDLSHNLFNNISNISSLSNLNTLDLSFNSLQSLPLTTFLKMNQLRELNLEATNLTTLEHGIFSQQYNLTRLDVSFNRLQKLDLTVLTAAARLEHLHIDGNNLTSIQYQRLPAMFPSLGYLGLFANSWNCSYLVDVVHFCRQHSIKVEPLKAYGTTLDASNVQGIYCKSTQESVLPVVAPIDHPLSGGKSSPGEFTNDQLLQMLRDMNRTTEQLLHEMVRSIHERAGNGGVVGAGSPAIVSASCTELHAYNYQVFILLILSVILIINVGFLLWIQHNANVRRAVDRTIIFRREQGASVQTALHEEL
ncbi:leucine-rich repeat transmembrane neuronal protein 3-like [Anopheles maculipalpis]|uniref:leucine-rich repeat transmembrane neuronal protein 3-like n=1 Tax=Anopheles maculipalpis TaxID=1496333 RepID=UPI002159A1C8|nr:leucine-rich repeat transmembrane neuronal protein 3-like [Anopheles maculipalpis]